MKYMNIISITICLITYVILTLLPILLWDLGMSQKGFSPILLAANMAQQYFFAFIFLIIFSFIGIILCYLLAPLYLIIHKLIFGRKMNYGIIETTRSKRSIIIFKGIFPALLAINIALVLSPYPLTQELLLYYYVIGFGTFTQYFAFITVLIFIIGPSIGIFAGIWVLNEAGITYIKKEKGKEKNYVVEMGSTGKFFLSLIKGYAGFSIIFTFIELVTSFGWGLDPMTPVVMVYSPIILSILAPIPSILIFMLLKNHRKKFILKIARKMGITEKIDYPIN